MPRNMPKKIALALVLSVLMLSFYAAWMAGESTAHEIILEFSREAEIGEEISIDITYGHFPDEYDPGHSFYDELENGELKVIEPDGSEEELDFTRGEETYHADYTPAAEGIYWFTFTSTRPVVDRTDDGDGRQLRYYDAKAPLLVESEGGAFTIPATDLQVEVVSEGEIENNVDEDISLQVKYGDEPAADQSLTFVGPGEQAQTETTDEEGMFTFSPDREGLWFLHISSLTDRDQEGEFRVEEYDRVRYNSALYLEIEEEKGFFESLFD